MNPLMLTEEDREAVARSDAWLARVERERRAMTEPLRVERDRAAQIGVANLARLQRVFEA